MLANNDAEQPSTSASARETSSALVVPRLAANNKIILSAENRPLKLVKQPRIVLDEEDYTSELEKIIVRDYFPEVPKLRAQQAYLDALASNDVERIHDLHVRYSSNFTNANGPTAIRRFNLNNGRFDVDTDLEEVVVNPEGLNEESEDASSKKVNTDAHTVQTFVDTYISEDSKSFHDLMTFENKRHKARYDWIARAEEHHNAALIERARPLAVEADKQLIERQEQGDNRPADIDNWNYVARNNVLFGPPDAQQTVKEYTESMKAQNEKVINRAATRIDTTTLNWEKKTQASNQYALDKVDVTGEPTDHLHRAPDQFQPLPTPNAAIADDEAPLMTWGMIDGTPFRLDGGDMTPLPENVPTFKMPEMTKREVIAHDMVDKLKQQNRAKKAFSQKATSSLLDPHSRLTIASRMSIMSPAAHNFAHTKLGIKTKPTGLITKKTPGSINLRPPSRRPTPHVGAVGQTPDAIAASSRSTRLEPMESVINEQLLSVRRQRPQL